MTIDEAIEHSKEKAKEQRYYANFERNGMMYQSCIKCAEEHEQLVEWLEELKSMRNLDKTNFSDGYNRGIDDFLKEADATFPMQSDGTAVLRRLEKIADGLKGGGSGEQTKLQAGVCD
jgi:hypothetical protein